MWESHDFLDGGFLRRWRLRAPSGAAAALALVAALFALNVYRAATQSITADEAFSWRLFVSGAPAKLFNSYDASHHVLHSILCRISIALLGLSELTLRFPSLLGGLLYFITAWRLARHLFGDGWLMFGSVALLSLNPFVLDHLSVARGYGLAVALCLWSLLGMARFLAGYSHRAIDEAGRSGIYRIAIGLALSVSANLILLVPCAGLAAIFLAMLLADGAWSGGRARLAGELGMTVDSFIVPGIAAAFVILSLPLTKAGMSHFYVGTRTWTEALETLTTPSLRHHELLWDWPGYSRAVDNLLWVVDSVLVPLVLLMTAWVCLMAFRRAIRQRSFTRLERIDQFVLLAGGAMLISVGLVTAGHRVFGMPYPFARTGLYFVPLFTLTAVALWKRFGRPSTAALVVWSPPVLLTALVVVQFMLQLQATYYGQWRYDASTKKITGMIRQRRQAKPRATVRLGVSWVFEPSLEFYRRLYKLNWVEPLTRDGPKGDFDYYVLLPSDASLVEKMGLRVIYRDELSGAVLAEPGDMVKWPAL